MVERIKGSKQVFSLVAVHIIRNVIRKVVFMRSLASNYYKMKQFDKMRLLSKNFREVHSVDNRNDYSLRFPLHKYKKWTILECELIVNADNGDVNMKVLDENRNIYAPFYNSEYGKSDLLELVNRKILNKFKELGIVEITIRRDKKEK